MSERSDRLREALKRAGITAPEASERYGWNYNTLKSNLNGAIPFSYKSALKYGARLKVRAEWLYDGVDPMVEPSKRARRPDTIIPVVSWVSAGQVADIGQIEEFGDLERITVSGLPAGEYFATEVKGDSMDRVSPEGSTIIVKADDKHLVSSGYYLFSLHGETTYKRYYDDPVLRLEPFSVNPHNRPIYLTDNGWTIVGRVVRSFIDLD